MPSKRDANIAGLLMAAGGSKRLDSPKQLLKWGNDYLINHVIKTALDSKISRLYVILGSRQPEIQNIITENSVVIVENPDWQSGLSSSIKAGFRAVSDDVDGAFVLLVDQPFICVDLLNQMVAMLSQTKAQVIAPRVNGQQCNPVLFRHDVFPILQQVSGDKGAKALIKELSVEWLDWADVNLILDIDSDADYKLALQKLGV